MQDEFRFFNLSLASRLIVAGAFYAAGAAVELALMGSAYWLGLVVAALGWAPLFLKPATNKPDDQGLAEWRPVPMAEVDRLDDGLRETQKLKRKVSFLSFASAEAKDAAAAVKARAAMGKRRTALVVVMAAVVCFIALDVFADALSSAISSRLAFFVLANAAIFFVPALFFGRVKVFSPPEIAMKMPCFRALLADAPPPDVAVAPYIRFDKDKSGADVPEDLRIMYELKRPPSDLVGIQLQAAINNGESGQVPYMYAVVLTKGKSGRSYKIAERARPKGYEVEPGGDETYGTVVIRQETGGSGYETTPEECVELRGICLGLLASMGAAGLSDDYAGE